MLGIDYGSDSDEENDITPSPAPTAVKPTTSRQPTPNKTNKLSLPPPSAPSSSSSSSKLPSLPPPKTKKKIILELPKLSKHTSDDELSDSPPAKKPRLGGGGGGASSLLSMLPAPKKTKIELPAPQRVLGGGRPGIMYSSASRAPEEPLPSVGEDESQNTATTVEDDDESEDTTTITSMIPPSMLLKGKSKVQAPAVSKPTVVAEPTSSAPAVDFFSLGSSSTLTSSTPSLPSSSLTPSLPTTLSSAPKIEEFRPPSPTPTDPYPGYYQLPSGAWAQHDSTYYKSHSDRWAREYEAQIRAYERERSRFDGGEVTTEVSAASLADAARAAREEKKSLTQRAGREVDKPVPKVALNPTKMGGVARSRHQLHSLLADAYMNREAIEDKIAQGKRNRKEAGNKYGF